MESFLTNQTVLPKRFDRRLVTGLLATVVGVFAIIDPAHASGIQTLDKVDVTAVNTVANTADSATEGTVLKTQLDQRPVYRVGELLETVPGLIVTQHSGEGKANQYFLRGFNLDHGTDIEITVDDMPVNERTHAHGQGYSDLNFMIPELANGIQYRKGTYAADEGDFATAGAVHIDYLDQLDHDLASVSAGTLGDERVFVAESRPVVDGTLLVAGELTHLGGPFQISDNFKKGNAFLRYSQGTSDNGFSVTGMYLIDTFHASNQIPQRAVQDGQISRFGVIDPTDKGHTERYSFSGKYVSTTDHGQLKASAYVIGYDFRLFNDFDYSIDFPSLANPALPSYDPTNPYFQDQLDGGYPTNDQFEQQDHRHTYGTAVAYTSFDNLFGADTENTYGFQLRADDIHDTLSRTTGRALNFIVRSDYVTEVSSGLYFENKAQWLDNFRSVFGMRGDVYYGSDNSTTSAPEIAATQGLDALAHVGNSGETSKGLLSPKLQMIFGPWDDTEFYADAGRGFHSNDVRGAVGTVDVIDSVLGQSIVRQGKVPLLTPATGAEVGVRTTIVPHLQASLALFQLDLASELTFSGDAAATSAGRPSRRQGVEISTFYTPFSWLIFDGDFAFSRARFEAEDDGSADTIDGQRGSFIPGSPKIIASAGFTIHDLERWQGGLVYRYFGPRPLLEDGSVRSAPTQLVNARVGYKISENLTAQVDVFNIFNSQAHQIDYYYPSQLPNETQPVNDIHFHPVEPLSARFTVNLTF